MKRMSKERWRELHGIREPKDPADPAVLGRRHWHEAIARWEVKWLNRFWVISGTAAFVVVLLPVLLDPWRAVVMNTPVLAAVYLEFSGLGGWLYFLLAMMLATAFYSASKWDGKKYSEYGYPINLQGVGSPQDILFAELYPRTKLEERVFWVDSLGGLLGSLFVPFVVFGGFAAMLKSGGY
ncbi:hypothetical protein [Serpentinimonas barnesii]|uniref:hypothetical protein n=1 Tax=Serpentinimonas barnesii TaxID=1458427 RepID=UPI0011EA6D29|nr:hypothetical protein [Serpentinimonas barnesii]